MVAETGEVFGTRKVLLAHHLGRQLLLGRPSCSGLGLLLLLLLLLLLCWARLARTWSAFTGLLTEHDEHERVRRDSCLVYGLAFIFNLLAVVVDSLFAGRDGGLEFDSLFESGDGRCGIDFDKEDVIFCGDALELYGDEPEGALDNGAQQNVHTCILQDLYD